MTGSEGMQQTQRSGRGVKASSVAEPQATMPARTPSPPLRGRANGGRKPRRRALGALWGAVRLYACKP